VGEHAGALPNLVVVGAMKCGTTALHGFLDRHPEIAMSDPKELNFFFGPAAGSGDDAPWAEGNRHRGVGWYRHQFPVAAPVRGESSPGYTSPSEPHVAARMAALIPGARLVYLVRDPVERAVSVPPSPRRRDRAAAAGRGAPRPAQPVRRPRALPRVADPIPAALPAVPDSGRCA